MSEKKFQLLEQNFRQISTKPIVEKVDPDATPIMWFALSGERSVRELSTYADEILKEQLQKINGVGAIRLYGLRLRQARVWLDADRLRHMALPPRTS